MWNNQLETAQESKITFKARLENYEKIRDVIQKNCSYEVPEITYTNLDGGNEAYLNWLKESTPDVVIVEKK
jgi:periplasmic divalent cation tolerance protein